MQILRRSVITLALGAVSWTGVAQAALVQTDFNNLNTGVLRGQTAAGTGMTGDWSSNSGVPDVTAAVGDLTAPVSTGFALTQSGIAAQAIVLDNSAERQNGVDLTAALTGTVWGSFLVNTNGGGTAGLGFNNPVSNASLADRPRLMASGTDLIFNAGAGADVVASDALLSSGDSLVLFRVVFDGSTGFTIDAWVNPDLTSPLPSAQLSASSTNVNSLSLSRLAVGGASGVSGNSYIDFITLSDNENAFEEVTGLPIPEPGSLCLFGIGVVLSFKRFRR